MIVYYDGWCPFCQAAKARMARLDRWGRLQFRSLRDPGVVAEAGVPLETLAARLHVRTDRGRLVSGVSALVAIAGVLPLLWPLWPVLVASQWLGLGRWLYDWVARNRKIVPAGTCTESTCPIHHEP